MCSSMGGSALKETKTRRYEKFEYLKLIEDLIPQLTELFKTELYVPQSYFEKQDFGDLDVLVKTPIDLNIKEALYSQLHANQVVKNSNVYSFDYKEFQIDLILTPSQNFEIAKVFYDFNDLGNLIGKLAYVLGLKFGDSGLRYIVVNEATDKRLLDIELTQNPQLIFEILDLEYDRYSKGFNNMTEVFEFVAKSKWFSPRYADLRNLTAYRRHRDKKRKTSKLFYEWVQKQNIPDTVEKFDKQSTRELIDLYFPKVNIFKLIDDLELKENIRKSIAAKFNGHIIMEHFPELSGKNLGHWIQRFKESFENYDEFILNNLQDEILKNFTLIYKEK